MDVMKILDGIYFVSTNVLIRFDLSNSKYIYLTKILKLYFLEVIATWKFYLYFESYYLILYTFIV